jgi:hypothetical protein
VTDPIQSTGGDQTADGNVNQVKSKLKNGEITIQEQIERSYEETSYGRSMSQ